MCCQPNPIKGRLRDSASLGALTFDLRPST